MMNSNDEHLNETAPQNTAFPNFFTSKDNQIAIYTSMCILRKMKRQLGIGAMHEYLDHYLKVIDLNNPKLGFAVTKALTLMSVEKMYKDALGEKN